MQRKTFHRFVLTAAAALTMGWSAAQAQTTEISFFYPVAVGGAITKTIDDLAASFSKENPGIKVNPIYAGTYQETIVKALTAHKSGQPPVTSVLLSTDMFTMIDEDAIVPFDTFVKTAVAVVVTPTTSSIAVAGGGKAAIVARLGAGGPVITQSATWVSSDPTKATVSDNGVIKAVAAGSTTVTASHASATTAGTVTVTVT